MRRIPGHSAGDAAKGVEAPIWGRSARVSAEGLAIGWFMSQAQGDKFSFGARGGGEPKSKHEPARGGTDGNENSFTEDLGKLSELGSEASMEFPVGKWGGSADGPGVDGRQQDKGNGEQ